MFIYKTVAHFAYTGKINKLKIFCQHNILILDRSGYESEELWLRCNLGAAYDYRVLVVTELNEQETCFKDG